MVFARLVKIVGIRTSARNQRAGLELALDPFFQLERCSVSKKDLYPLLKDTLFSEIRSIFLITLIKL